MKTLWTIPFPLRTIASRLNIVFLTCILIPSISEVEHDRKVTLIHLNVKRLDSEFFNRTLSRKRRSRNTSLVDSSSSSARRIRSIIHDYRPHITEEPSGDFVACPAARKAEEHAQVLSIAQFLCLLDTSSSSSGTLFERTTQRYRSDIDI